MAWCTPHLQQAIQTQIDCTALVHGDAAQTCLATCSRLQELEVCRKTWQEAMQAELDGQRRAMEEAEHATRAALEARQVSLLLFSWMSLLRFILLCTWHTLSAAGIQLRMDSELDTHTLTAGGAAGDHRWPAPQVCWRAARSSGDSLRGSVHARSCCVHGKCGQCLVHGGYRQHNVPAAAGALPAAFSVGFNHTVAGCRLSGCLLSRCSGGAFCGNASAFASADQQEGGRDCIGGGV